MKLFPQVTYQTSDPPEYNTSVEKLDKFKSVTAEKNSFIDLVYKNFFYKNESSYVLIVINTFKLGFSKIVLLLSLINLKYFSND